MHRKATQFTYNTVWTNKTSAGAHFLGYLIRCSVIKTLVMHNRPLSLRTLGVAIFAIAIANLQACAVLSPAATPGRLAEDFNSSLKVIGAKQKRPSESARDSMQEVQLWFPVISGNFYGTPNKDAALKITPNEDFSFSVDISKVAADIAKQAAPFDPQATALLVEPPQTRVARVSSYALGTYDGEPLGLTSWRQTKSGLTKGQHEVMLTYFDRPCHILGTVIKNGVDYRHELNIPSAGFYWLHAVKESSRSKLFISGDKPAQVQLYIQLTEGNLYD